MRHDFADGKYTVINDNGKLTALRHGEPWVRDLVGDNLVYWMLVKVHEQAAELNSLKESASEAPVSPLIAPLKALLQYVEEDMEGNSPNWRPQDVPQYVQAVLALKALGMEHKYVCESSVKEVVDDVVQRGEEYGFQQDEDSVRGAISESAALLILELSEEEIVLACDRILEKQRETVEAERE